MGRWLPDPRRLALEDDAGQPLGRIYDKTGGSQNGGWFWRGAGRAGGRLPCRALKRN